MKNITAAAAPEKAFGARAVSPAQIALPLEHAGEASYFNTTSLAGHELESARRASARQDDVVKAIFVELHKPLTPSDVWRVGCDRGVDWLRTSVRRSVCTLTDAGELVKLGSTRAGPYGRKEHLRALREPGAPSAPNQAQ